MEYELIRLRAKLAEVRGKVDDEKALRVSVMERCRGLEADLAAVDEIASALAADLAAARERAAKAEADLEVFRFRCFGLGAHVARLEEALRLLQEAIRAVGARGYWDGAHWTLHVPKREADALFDIAYGKEVTAALAAAPGEERKP
jgi:predicted nuclease with TOPRIM domain